MTSVKVNTFKGSFDEFIKLVRSTFNLNEYPWDTIDDGLLYLTFVPKCKNTYPKIVEKYKACSHQTLETYGDKILGMIITMITFDSIQLRDTPGLITKINVQLNSNRTLTDVMINKNACQLIRSSDFVITEDNKVHNRCADSFEALLGTLFIQTYYYLKIDPLLHIKKWIEKNTDMLHRLHNIIQSDYVVHQPNNLQSLIQNIESDENVIKRLPNIISQESVIISNQNKFDDAMKRLGWKHQIKTKDGLFYIYNDKDELIGVGTDIDDAKENSVEYLTKLGYVTVSDFKKTFVY